MDQLSEMFNKSVEFQFRKALDELDSYDRASYSRPEFRWQFHVEDWRLLQRNMYEAMGPVRLLGKIICIHHDAERCLEFKFEVHDEYTLTIKAKKALQFSLEQLKVDDKRRAAVFEAAKPKRITARTLLVAMSDACCAAIGKEASWTRDFCWYLHPTTIADLHAQGAISWDPARSCEREFTNFVPHQRHIHPDLITGKMDGRSIISDTSAPVSSEADIMAYSIKCTETDRDYYAMLARRHGVTRSQAKSMYCWQNYVNETFVPERGRTNPYTLDSVLYHQGVHPFWRTFNDRAKDLDQKLKAEAEKAAADAAKATPVIDFTKLEERTVEQAKLAHRRSLALERLPERFDSILKAVRDAKYGAALREATSVMAMVSSLFGMKERLDGK